jgi:hypothetical protein
MQPPAELISPAQSQVLMALLAFVCALVAGGFGFKRGGAKLGLCGLLLGASVWPAWKAHEWATRYDPQTGYFGLESVKVLALEATAFVVVGALAGAIWSKFSSR